MRIPRGAYIDPLKDLGPLLLTVEKPGRYVGGEYGRLAKKDAPLQTLIAFPDLYEIGMSNQALRIIYNRLNQLEGISCDRAFAPAPDFEALLKKQELPLYGLDTGIPLGHLDLLLFTLGYELGITAALAMLEAGNIPLRASDRGEQDPLVILGGPCVSNPLPYGPFADACWMGEAEGGFFELMQEVLELKRGGKGRNAGLERIRAHPSIWVPGKTGVKRAIDGQFALRGASPAVFPVPTMKAVQHHGAVEIMRGCPNGCRFCHAGYWYRPMRQKSAETVHAETAALIKQGGYREISLSSLSTGDYRHLESLTASLHSLYGPRHISFQLPSLRVSTFSLSLLSRISAVRKSGLTFAVETPVDAWQLSINKEVSRDMVIAILHEARKQGWRGAKFYFMIGLPVEDEQAPRNEEEEIVDFIRDLARRTGMHFHINVGTFIPKPHTPYQRARQLGETEARRKLEAIRRALKPLGHKVGTQDPFISLIEGIMSRGDSRVGAIIEEAYRKGCRLDAWTEYIRKDLWQALLETHDSLVQELLGERSPEIPLGWEAIDSGISPEYLHTEGLKSRRREPSPRCTKGCSPPCGVCNKRQGIAENPLESPPLEISLESPAKQTGSGVWRMIFTFSKKGSGIFHPHLTMMELFSMAFIRAEIPVLYSQGFNPLPRLEIASPLSLGIEAEGEIAAIDAPGFLRAQEFKDALDERLPEGIRIGEALPVYIPLGAKKHSLSSLLWGYTYRNKDGGIDLVPAGEEKTYRLSRCGLDTSPYGLIRRGVLAKSAEDPALPGSYFSVYRELYPLGEEGEKREKEDSHVP